MDNKIINYFRDKPFVVPRVMIRNYRKMGITDEELIVLIFILDCGNEMVYNPLTISEELGMDKYRVMQVINDLTVKNFIDVKVISNSDGKMEEYIYTDGFYNKLFNILIDGDALESDKSCDNVDIYSLFEQELGRTISPMEVQKINDWVNAGFSSVMIQEALREAVYKNARSFNYINSILYSWRQKGIKSIDDIRNEKRNFRNNKKDTMVVFDYNWLDDE